MQQFLENKQEEFHKQLNDGISEFLLEQMDETFYAFALDCNIYEQGEINFCFNTIDEWEKTKIRYGEYNEEELLETKYNSGDWEKYQGFETIYLFDDWVEEEEDIEYCLNWLCEQMILFLDTSIFQAIPKTEDFKILVYDHDTDVTSSQERFEDFSDIELFKIKS
ncbi:hypothetical protein BCR26_02095 [Enterococcus rivorum]|uniref:DUF4303 domain-containing protein n=1 Tax=Enterococcus rivorum TaxID=762845 RepID=A0A1E5KZ36_9ENTE|nr:hypothetical protein BCR26_02095 [Enterococcus rivorum]